jgi:hypothetical protein
MDTEKKARDGGREAEREEARGAEKATQEAEPLKKHGDALQQGTGTRHGVTGNDSSSPSRSSRD